MANRIKLATLGPSVGIRELIRWRRGLPHLDGIDEDTQAARRLWPGDRLAGPSARSSFNLRIFIRTGAERGAPNSAAPVYEYGHAGGGGVARSGRGGAVESEKEE